ncbi:MAG: metal ABC transporter solute-binding protein, Zn/Mn family [Planctomycetota bacterium]|jgi:manganese/iron transport system substrate-binding protein
MNTFKFIAAVFVISLSLCSFSSAEENGKKLVIVSSTTQIADFARNVVGDRCIVKCILGPGADPHTYMPTPDDVKMVLSADLCLENGMHLEGKSWMKTLAKDAEKPIVTCTNGVKALEIDEDGQSIKDPHAWFSPKYAAVYINNIYKALLKHDPDGKGEYKARTELLLQQMRILDSWIKKQVSAIPPAERILVTSHDAFNYFCYEYKFNENNNYLSLAPVGWSTGSEVGAGMTPQRRKKVIDGLKKTGAKAVFVETSVNPKLIRGIAREAGIKIGGELYSDSMGAAGTAGESYVGMMRENVIKIVNALK